ncbi:FkbM family methyltransferase [Roseibacterium sp. SDUM158016]|uniref:FkbM family methyltransferase n=1 Tax=Roseicyclus sediminis TaxID=2980997 RepID=UPI0021D0B77E|nr:FkbM family methyltransferase [Roseibacterium sp. SDUM158016]MCU4654174.1 FkbM family methyltransferase [Roseibacterium sp. SDUM158016]
MANPFRNVFLNYHRLRNTAFVSLDGVRVHSAEGRVPRAVRNGLYKKTYEDAERRLLQQVVRPGDRVLEIGAGIGAVGLLAARITGGQNVLSYEANPDLEPVIEANYALNETHPTLRMKAITTDGAPIVFYRADNILSSSVHERREAQNAITVESDSLADVIAEFSPDVLVMDVEGAETDLLKDAPLGGIRAIVLEVHPHIVGQAAIDELKSGLASAGFRTDAEDRLTVLMTRSG